MEPELFYQLALTLVPNIGDVHTRILVQHFGKASSIFHARLRDLERLEGIGSVRAQAIKSFRDFSLAEQEMKFIEDQKIRTLFYQEPDYPARLQHCYDAPILLFYKGEADLNNSRIISIVGTRSHTDYGKQFTEKLVAELGGNELLIVSGLAFGIDCIAHKSSLKNNIPTVGVVGHGLDKVYPYAHRGLVKEILEQGGGILTEFFSGVLPDRHHFPLRNRIVAGLCDATVVIETHIKGGSMITAKLADGYNRDVFAVPGRVTDSRSEGCNYLIQNNKAILLTSAEELLDIMGWKTQKTSPKKQKELFPELTPEEQQVVALLEEKETLHVDDLTIHSGLSGSTLAAALLNLEMEQIITSLTGKTV
jgi:DNA processing protein